MRALSRRLIAVVTLSTAISAVIAADAPTCGPNKQCPEEAPCCGLYNQCGVGAYCLGGCNPTYSHSLEACVPGPVCKSADYKFDSLDDIVPITKYKGDASAANWVSEGSPLEYDGAVLLTMAKGTTGTVLSSTHYVWYGNVSATIATSQGAGVVTAFLLMSNARDEIDYEWVGNRIEETQTNYYFQGIADYGNGQKLPVTDTRKNEHTYTVNWTPDRVDWIIDGDVRRTLSKADTWDPATNRYKFPQTPARIMLSLWPAGLPTSGEGTIEWGGGLVDWNSEYMKNGYYYATVKDVTVNCYDAPKGAAGGGSKSYEYTNVAATNDTIKITDKQVVLKSLSSTGEKPDYDPNGTPAKKNETTPESVPGMSGIINHDDYNNTASNSSTTSSSSPTGSSSANPSSSDDSGFSQTTDTAPQEGAGSVVMAPDVGSLVAVVGLGLAVFAF